MRAEGSRQVGIPRGQHSALLIPRAQQMLSDNTILGVAWSDGDLVVHLALLLLLTHPPAEPLLCTDHLAATHRPEQARCSSSAAPLTWSHLPRSTQQPGGASVRLPLGRDCKANQTVRVFAGRSSRPAPGSPTPLQITSGHNLHLQQEELCEQLKHR